MKINRRKFLAAGALAAAVGATAKVASAAEVAAPKAKRKRKFVAACPPSSREYGGRRPGPPRVMVIGAHPDDADIICGGTTVKLIKRGFKVKFVSITDGRMGHHRLTPDETAKTRRGGAGTTSLRTKRADFYDFDLSCDVLVPPKSNSGIYLRGRYEIQVLDSFGRGNTDCHYMGALYDLIEPTASAEKPAGEWQHIDMTVYKRHQTVTLNGVKIIDNKPIPGVTPGAIDGDEFVPGPILLQGDHSNASFRNMVLTPIVK